MSWEFFKSFVETPNLYLLSYVSRPHNGAQEGIFYVPNWRLFRELINKKLVVGNFQHDQRDFFIALAVGVAVLVLLYATLRLVSGSLKILLRALWQGWKGLAEYHGCRSGTNRARHPPASEARVGRHSSLAWLLQ